MSNYERAAEEIAQRVTAAMRERQDVRTAQIANRARYAMSSFALARSAGNEYRAACERYGDAAAAGDPEALERIHDAGRLADTVVGNSLPDFPGYGIH